MHRHAAILLALAIGAMPVLGCFSLGDPMSRGDQLKEAQRRYTEAIRWGDIEKAARFVDPVQRDGFLALSDSFESIRITDYEIGELDLDPETLAHAEVDVTYRGYVLPEFVERRVSDRQVWYRDEATGNEWRVRPGLDALIANLGAAPR